MAPSVKLMMQIWATWCQ